MSKVKGIKKVIVMTMACVMLTGAAAFLLPANIVTVHADTMTGRHCGNSGCQAYLWEDSQGHLYCRECGFRYN